MSEIKRFGKKKYQALVCDLDGTLLDTLHDLAHAANRSLAHFGYPEHTVESYRYFVGDGARKLVERILPENKKTTEIIEKCLLYFKSDYGRNWNLKTRVYPGIASMLTTAVASDLRLTVLSNKPHPYTLQCVEKFLSDWQFALVLGQQKVIARKPSPEGALEIVRHLDVLPEQCIYLGDTAVDMQTAVAAGMLPVGVLWGFRGAEELWQSGASRVVASPSELFGLFDD